MLEYVFIDCKNTIVKVRCSAAESNLPDFAAIGITAEDYEARLKQHDEYLAREAEIKKRRHDYDELFYGNLALFMEHYEEIISEPRFANIRLPHPLFGSMYITFSNREITVGEILKLLKNEPNFRGTCPECGDTVYLISFGFSPLSGRVFPTHRCYAKCKKTFSGEYNGVGVGCSGNKLRDIRNMYSPIEYNSEPSSIYDLLHYLGKTTNRRQFEYYEDNCVGGMRIGKSKQLVAFVENDETGRLSFPHPVPQAAQPIDDVDVIIPQNAWTESFALAVLKTGFPFGYLPGHLNRQGFIEKIVAETDYVPNLGELSPQKRTIAVCVKALNSRSDFHRKRLWKLVPEHLREEVERQLK